MNKLTEYDREELTALLAVNTALNGPSFIMRGHWRRGYASLAKRGFVKWGPPPLGFNPRKFAGTTITPAGRLAISGKSDSEEVQTTKPKSTQNI